MFVHAASCYINGGGKGGKRKRGGVKDEWETAYRREGKKKEECKEKECRK